MKLTEQEKIKRVLKVLIQETEKETITTVEEMLALIKNEIIQKQFI